MAASGAYVEGLTDIVKALELLGAETDDLKAIFNGVSEKAASIIRANTPVQSGRLRASIKANNAKNKAVVRAGSAAKVPYARPLNYGWPARNIAGRGFMQSADKVLTPEVLAAQVQDGIDDLIKRLGLDL